MKNAHYWAMLVLFTCASANAQELPANGSEAESMQPPKVPSDEPQTATRGQASGDAETATAKTDAKPPGVSIVPFAMIGYTPEMGVVQGGAAVGVYRRPLDSGARDSQILLGGSVSVKKQVALALKPDIYFFGDDLHLGGTLKISRSPNVFYGIGNNTRAEDSENYTPVTFEFEISPKWRLLPGMYLGLDGRFVGTSMDQTKPGGMLDSGSIAGSSGGRTVEIGFAGFYDTRDNTLYPHHGHIISLLVRAALPSLSSDFKYRVLIIDARKYWSLPWGDRHVIAAQALAELRDGAPPFYELGLLGGENTMRGYYKGRFRDRNYLAMQVEYRLPLFWRFGAVCFASAGEVAYSLSDVSASPMKFAVGSGLRFAPKKNVPVNIRLDVGYGNEPLFYLNINEAF
jgi:hypothetical protein